MRMSMQYWLIVSLSFTFACNSGESETPDASVADASSLPTDILSGVYNVETVTCAGQVQPINVVATVTFDETSYLEEWDFPNSDCELSLAGTVEANDDEVTLEDVAINCMGSCPPNVCEAECPVDQVYEYTKEGGELLLSFTQQGDEFGCGPCGDGVASTYLLVSDTL